MQVSIIKYRWPQKPQFERHIINVLKKCRNNLVISVVFWWNCHFCMKTTRNCTCDCQKFLWIRSKKKGRAMKKKKQIELPGHFDSIEMIIASWFNNSDRTEINKIIERHSCSTKSTVHYCSELSLNVCTSSAMLRRNFYPNWFYLRIGKIKINKLM